jgi:hypothetical protein
VPRNFLTSQRFGSLAVVALIALGLASTVTGLPNRWAQDDRPIIERNPAVHTLAHPRSFFTTSYWPKPYPPALYRPLASLGYAVQWVAGGGRPVVFRALSIALLLLGGLALFRLGSAVLPLPAAWLAAAFFMVHPVHVEAVAAAVNQSELAVGALAAVAARRYLAVRGGSGSPRYLGVTMLVLTLVALLFKETGVTLIGIIIATELVLAPTSAGPRPSLAGRLTALRPVVLVMLLGAVSFAALRSLTLRGDLLGTFVAEGLEGQTMGQRALTMLGVVPHWFRLLLWPAHLRGDYSPMEIVPATGWAAEQTLGALLLAGAVGAVVATWSRAPVIAYGLLWTAIALFPVSNVLVPTGVVLAERTLYLPSMGMMLAVGGAAAWATTRLRHPLGHRILAAAAGVVILLGVTRSASRQLVWRDNDTFWRQTAIDAPRSYRARHAHAQILSAAGQTEAANREFRLAIGLFPQAWGAYFGHANELRRAGMCEDAVVFYQRTLLVEPTAAAARNGMIACLMHLARYREAGLAAREGIEVGTSPGQRKLYGRFLAIADSAETANAPPGTIRLTVRAADTLP